MPARAEVARAPEVSSLVAAWRLARAVLHGVHGALICATVFPFLDEAGRRERVRWWSQRMLAVMGIALQSEGVPAGAPVLVAANHVSWLDILAINAVRPVRFVSKADVRRWPLIGYLVASAGTIFIERERKRDAMRVVHQMTESLRAGDVVGIFPEGTTGDGRTLLPFHANLLQAAVSAGVPVQPLVLRFSDRAGAYSDAPLYLGETTLMQSVWAVVGASGLHAHVALLEPVAGLADRRELSARVRERIGARLPPP